MNPPAPSAPSARPSQTSKSATRSPSKSGYHVESAGCARRGDTTSARRYGSGVPRSRSRISRARCRTGSITPRATVTSCRSACPWRWERSWSPWAWRCMRHEERRCQRTATSSYSAPVPSGCCAQLYARRPGQGTSSSRTSNRTGSTSR